ncbi:MAG: SDR family NAD(P)-dependent oxidoreductase, partial [Solirubrobacterales bacterium]
MGEGAELGGKVAVVTGGASGLGLATARALAQAGAQVLVVDLDEEGGRTAAEEIGGAFFAADVSSLDENLAMVAEAERLFGRLDLVYLNAGVSSGIGLDASFDEEQ